MLKIVVSVADKAAQTFGQPFFVPSAGAAIRSFSDEINRVPGEGQQNPLYSHPADYVLYQLGTFDESSGLLSAMAPAPVILVRGSACTSRSDIPPETPQSYLVDDQVAKSVVLS